MSAYIQFFIRHEDTFLPIGIFNRNNAIYRVFDGIAAWEKIRPIGEPILNDAEKIVKEFIGVSEKALARANEEKNMIADFKNSVEEKLQSIEEYNSYIAEITDDIKGLEAAQQYLWFLRDILESVEGTDFNKQPYLYVGVEVEGKIEELI